MTGPAAHLEMMMERRHFEHALAVAQLEIADLDDIGQRLDDVDDAHRNQDQRHIERERHAAHSAAEKQAARVTHEAFGGVEIV